MARSAHPRAGKKPAKPYHHGDLRRAFLDEALHTIQTRGVEHLTLRTVGERLGVSRSALYRHFADKQALLAEPDAAGRLGAERALLARETGMLRGLTSAPAPELRYSPYSNN